MRAALAIFCALGLFACDDPSAGDDDDGASSAGANDGAYALCVDRINDYRATLGLPAHARWTEAEGCSDGEAESDSQSGDAHGAFGSCQEWAQNECPGWPGPPEEMIGGCLDLMWDEGPGGGHYDNMSSTDYSAVACGFHVLSDGSVWSVQNFK